MKTPVRAPVEPHPVNPARPRPLPGPPKPPPPPQPRPRFTLAALTALLFVAAPILTAIVAVVAFGTSRLEAAVSHGAVAINGAPMVHADAGNSVGTASGLVFIGLGFAFLFVSLALAPLAPRHRPLRIARAGAVAVPGTTAAAPTSSG